MNQQTTELQRCLDRMRAGDDSYRQLLMDYAFDRLRLLARKLLARYPGVHRWEQTDDVLQNASVRLWKSLEEIKPVDVRNFFGLAATQIRRELLDLARHHLGPCGQGRKHDTNGGRTGDSHNVLEKSGPTDDPTTLIEWTEMHEKVEELSEEEREVFELLYYHNMKQEEAADVLGISSRSVKRRWRRARESIYQALHGSPPGER